MTSNDLESNLLEDILKTGYPFEMEITSRMQKEDWRVLNGSYYIDRDEQKGREIDVVAQIHNSETFASGLTLEVVFSMIVEVKKSDDKPWVFFTSESSSFEKKIFPIHVVNSPFSLAPRVLKKILKNNTVKVQERLGRNFYQGFTGNGSRDDIYKALSGTMKAMDHFIEANDNGNNNSGDRLLNYFESVVIIKDKLFESYLDDDGDLQLNEVNYIQTYFNYLSPNYPNNKRNVIHVINDRYLEEFLNERKEALDSLFNDLKTQESM